MRPDDFFLEDLKRMIDEEQQKDDPYERGFADKLYEDYDEEDIPLPVTKQSRRSDYTYYAQDYEEPVYRTEKPRKQKESMAKRVENKQKPSADPAPKKSKKKRGFLRFCLKFALVLLLLFAVMVGSLFLLAKQPKAEGDFGKRKDGCATILLAGTDESGNRTDTLMLLNINRQSRQISLMSIPRDTKVNSKYSPKKINGAYGINGKGEEGMSSLMEYVSECVGFRPDGYLLIDLDAFVELVDLMGGVKFDVPCDMYYEDPSQDLYINLKAGLQRLDGEQAMGLVRFRSGYSRADLERVNVQRAFISAAMDQWISAKNVLKVPAAAKLVSKYTLTDLSTRNLLWLATSVVLCGTDDAQMMTIPNRISSDGTYVMINPQETLEIVNSYFNPYERERTAEDFYIAS